MGRGCRPIALLQVEPPGAVDARGEDGSPRCRSSASAASPIPTRWSRIVRSGQYDIIGCAGPSIADPWLPRKIDEGRVEDIAECIGCNQCIARFEYGVSIVCTQNPTALEEYRRGWHPERFEPRAADELILVVGAGPAGLECARVLGRRGYRTHLVEADTTLGGHLRRCRAVAGARRMEPGGHAARDATAADVECRADARYGRRHRRRCSGVWRRSRRARHRRPLDRRRIGALASIRSPGSTRSMPAFVDPGADLRRQAGRRRGRSAGFRWLLHGHQPRRTACRLAESG